MPKMFDISVKKIPQQSFYSHCVVLWILVLLTLEVSSQSVLDTTEYKKIQSCPPAFLKLGRKCYYFGSKPETWFDAHYECGNRNSSLTSIVSKGQQKLLKKYVDKRFVNDRHERWIGGRYNEKQHIWVWGASGQSLRFTDFGTNTSSFSDLTWHCITMDPNLQNRWSAKKCSESKPYICQSQIIMKVKRKPFDIRKCDYELELTRKEAKHCLKLKGFVGQHPNEPAAYVHTTQPTIISPKMSYICPENMYLIGKKCYFFSKVFKSWHEAHYDCQENGTFLAMITNKKNDLKIREFLNDEFVLETDRWIGALYDEGEKRFKWFNGHPVGYKGFAKAALRNKNKYYSAIYMDPNLLHRWNISNKMMKKMYICQTNAKTIVMLGGNKNRSKLRKPDATITIIATNNETNNNI